MMPGSFLFATLLFAVPPLILGTWFVLLLRFGRFGVPFGWIRTLLDLQAEPLNRSRSWIVLAFIVFINLAVVFASPLILPSLQPSESLDTYPPGGKQVSLGTLTFSWFYSPYALGLILSLWLTLLCYFGLHYGLSRLKFPIEQVEQVRGIAIVIIQLLGTLVTLISFGRWCHFEPGYRNAILNFSLIELSPVTVLLTFGVALMLIKSLNEAVTIDEAGELHQQVAGRMTRLLLSLLILLGLIGGSLALLIHYERSVGMAWANEPGKSLRGSEFESKIIGIANPNGLYSGELAFPAIGHKVRKSQVIS